MGYTDRIPYEGKDARLIIQDKWRQANEAHVKAQQSGDYNDYFKAADLFDELNGAEAEQKAKQCRKAARLLLEADKSTQQTDCVMCQGRGFNVDWNKNNIKCSFCNGTGKR